MSEGKQKWCGAGQAVVDDGETAETILQQQRKVSPSLLPSLSPLPDKIPTPQASRIRLLTLPPPPPASPPVAGQIMEQLRDKALTADARKELKALFGALKQRLAAALQRQEQALQAAAAPRPAHPAAVADDHGASSVRRPAAGEEEAGRRPSSVRRRLICKDEKREKLGTRGLLCEYR